MSGGHSVAKHIGDVGSLGIVVGTLASWLPSIASLLSIVWFSIRIYETSTVQGLIGRRKDGPAPLPAADLDTPDDMLKRLGRLPDPQGDPAPRQLTKGEI